MNLNTSLSAIIKKALVILKNPILFYREMPKSGGYLEPVLFVTVMAVIVGLLMTVFSIFGLGIMGGMALGINTILFTTVMSIISSFIGAVILYFIWKLMGSNESYETSYRCIAYASVVYPLVALLGSIPYLSSAVSVLFGTYLMIIASVEVHHIKQKTAYIVFCIIGIIGLLSNISNEMLVRETISQTDDFTEQFDGFSNKTGDTGYITPEGAGDSMGGY
jgi:hypothetical protein